MLSRIERAMDTTLALAQRPEAGDLLARSPLAAPIGMLHKQHIDGCMLTAWSSNSSSGLTSAI